MKRKRFSVEQIVAVLKQAEAELIRRVGITEQTFLWLHLFHLKVVHCSRCLPCVTDCLSSVTKLQQGSEPWQKRKFTTIGILR